MMNREQLRKHGVTARRSADQRQSADIVARVRALAEYTGARVVFAYNAHDNEPDLAELFADSKHFAFPVCVGDSEMLAAIPCDGAFKPGFFGIMEPVVEDSIVLSPQEIDIVLAPGVLFDEQGYRLGHGRGYFDRYLTQCINAAFVGICYDEQLIGALPTQPHDVRMNAVITPTRSLCFA